MYKVQANFTNINTERQYGLLLMGITELCRLHDLEVEVKWEKILNEASCETPSVNENEQSKEVCVKCGKTFIPRLIKPLEICDECAEQLSKSID